MLCAPTHLLCRVVSVNLVPAVQSVRLPWAVGGLICGVRLHVKAWTCCVRRDMAREAPLVTPLPPQTGHDSTTTRQGSIEAGAQPVGASCPPCVACGVVSGQIRRLMPGCCFCTPHPTSSHASPRPPQDWMRKVHSDLQKAPPTHRTVTIAEVQAHAKEDDAWMVLRGKVSVRSCTPREPVALLPSPGVLQIQGMRPPLETVTGTHHHPH